MTELIWSFAPWFVFLLTARLTSVGIAIGAGAVAAVVVLVRAFARGHVHLLDVISTIYFLGLAALAVVAQPPDLDHWGAPAQAASHLVLTAVVWASILVGRPFTEAYARETTPQRYWNTPTFHRTNMRISAAWGAAFAVGSASLLLAAASEQRPIILRVLIPFGTLYAAFKYTVQARDAAPPSDAAGREHAGSPNRAPHDETAI
jgi:hypothetical protein